MSARLDRTALLAAFTAGIAYACRAPLWLAVVVGVVSAAVAWRLNRNP